jgi:hypothetical protein
MCFGSIEAAFENAEEQAIIEKTEELFDWRLLRQHSWNGKRSIGSKSELRSRANSDEYKASDSHPERYSSYYPSVVNMPHTLWSS